MQRFFLIFTKNYLEIDCGYGCEVDWKSRLIVFSTICWGKAWTMIRIFDGYLGRDEFAGSNETFVIAIFLCYHRHRCNNINKCEDMFLVRFLRQVIS